MNVTQATHTRLDDVLIVLGLLFAQFEQLQDAADENIKAAVQSSIERRWQKADQTVFIIAVFLNPWIKLAPFRMAGWNTCAGLFGLLRSLYTRFFPGEQIPASLAMDIRSYLENRGDFARLQTYVGGTSEVSSCINLCCHVLLL